MKFSLISIAVMGAYGGHPMQLRPLPQYISPFMYFHIKRIANENH